MSPSVLSLVLLSPCLAVLISLDIDSSTYRLAVIDTNKKTDPSESMKDRVEESTCISFAEEGRRFDDSPSRTLPSSATVCGYFPWFRTSVAGHAQIENTTYISEKWVDSVSGTASVQLAGENWGSEELLGMLLEHVREKVEETYKGKEVEYVVVVPRCWTRTQRLSLLELAEVAKMKVIGLIHRTAAVALGYALGRNDPEVPQTALIFHLSRDFLETSLASFSMKRISVQKVTPVIDIISSYTTPALSTKLIDEQIALYLAQKFESTHRISLKDDFNAQQRLSQKASDVRKMLLTKDQIVVSEELKGKVLKYVMKSSEYKEILKGSKAAIVDAIEESLRRADIVKANLTNMIVVGEESRNSFLQGVLQDIFSSRLPISLHEETAVGRGAVLFAANISEQFQTKTTWISDARQGEVRLDCKEVHGDEPCTHSEVLFEHNTPLGSRKLVIVNCQKEVKCEVRETVDGGQSTPLIEMESTGVTDFVTTYSEPISQFFMFQLDFSGLLIVESANVFLVSDPNIRASIELKTAETSTPKPLSESDLKELVNKMDQTKAKDKRKRLSIEEQIKLQNTLRAYKALLHDKGFLRITTEVERGPLVSIVSRTDEWLSLEEGKKATLADFTEKISTLQSSFAESHERLQESKTRPDALKAASTQLTALTATMVNLNSTKDWIPIEEREEVFRELEKVKERLESIQREHEEKNPWETVSLKSNEIRSTVAEVAKSVEMIQKAVKPKPIPPPPPPQEDAIKPKSDQPGKPQPDTATKPKEESKKKDGPRTDL